jgi:hypothetical protein
MFLRPTWFSRCRRVMAVRLGVRPHPCQPSRPQPQAAPVIAALGTRRPASAVDERGSGGVITPPPRPASPLGVAGPARPRPGQRSVSHRQRSSPPGRRGRPSQMVIDPDHRSTQIMTEWPAGHPGYLPAGVCGCRPAPGVRFATRSRRAATIAAPLTFGVPFRLQQESSSKANVARSRH